MTGVEEWRPVVGYEGWYEISSFGRIRRIKAASGTQPYRVLTPHLDHFGYPYVILSRHSKTARGKLHILVAAAFIGPRPTGKVINHIDGNQANPVPENLEYITQGANIEHARRTGKLRQCVGVEINTAKLNDEAVRVIRSLRGVVTAVSLASTYNVRPGTIRLVWAGRYWKHVT